MVEQKTRLQKGDRVTVTGYGRTARWGQIKGTVTRRFRTYVFVIWDNCSFEDQMGEAEVQRA